MKMIQRFLQVSGQFLKIYIQLCRSTTEISYDYFRLDVFDEMKPVVDKRVRQELESDYFFGQKFPINDVDFGKRLEGHVSCC